ncbi:MAG TPA: hypothetical protein VGR69_03325 [Candidatus Rubrimentiphilum sp.]|nr:hypothetical protein [Candidatus Rubrimentiphilum sp.]
MSNNGEVHGSPGDLELRDLLIIKTTDEEKELEFEVVGLIQDDKKQSFAVLYCEAEDEFVVTDAQGNLLESAAMAQEILDDFFDLAEESSRKDSN